VLRLIIISIYDIIHFKKCSKKLGGVMNSTCFRSLLALLFIFLFSACQAGLPIRNIIEDELSKEAPQQDPVDDTTDDTVCPDSDFKINNLYDALLYDKLVANDESKVKVDEELEKAFEDHLIIEKSAPITKLMSEDPSLLINYIKGDCFYVDESDPKAVELINTAWTVGKEYTTAINVTVDKLVFELQLKKIEELKGNTFNMSSNELVCKLCGASTLLDSYKAKKQWCSINQYALMNELCSKYALKDETEIKEIEALYNTCIKDPVLLDAAKKLSPIENALNACKGDTKCLGEIEAKESGNVYSIATKIGETCTQDQSFYECVSSLYKVAACKTLMSELDKAKNRCPDIAKALGI
jgi:hypothetical protein